MTQDTSGKVTTSVISAKHFCKKQTAPNLIFSKVRLNAVIPSIDFILCRMYIVMKDPIRSNLLFLSPIHSRKEAYRLKTILKLHTL